GCTKEACGFRDDLAKFARKDVAVLGVSADGVQSHQKFTEKYDLNFPLLSDTDHKVAELYGVWQEKNMYGRKSWGIKRTTFIIDEQGKIARVFGKVDTSSHSHDVLEALRGPQIGSHDTLVPPTSSYWYLRDGGSGNPGLVRLSAQARLPEG